MISDVPLGIFPKYSPASREISLGNIEKKIKNKNRVGIERQSILVYFVQKYKLRVLFYFNFKAI